MNQTTKNEQGGLEEHPFPFMDASFAPGESQQYIDAIRDKEMQILARCERFYYQGEGKKCSEMALGLLGSDRFAIKVSAVLMSSFGNICAGNPESAKEIFMQLRQANEGIGGEEDPISYEEKVYLSFLNNLFTVLLHLHDNALTEMDMKVLPGGIRLIAFYVLAHNHYLKGEFGQAIGVCETALSVADRSYPIGEIYLHLIMTIAYMNINQRAKAKTHFLRAWEIAKPEGFIQPFSEHHGLLQGMIEIHLRKSDPESYERIIRQVYVFAAAWRKVHNPETNHYVADNLTTTEFTIAMLASKGWSNSHIADHVGITVNTVRTHIASVYQKLCIKSRKELYKYMLK